MRQHLVATIYGQVQGVNLRSMIKVQALALGIVGLVLNLPEGTVRLEAEGDQEALEKLMRWINSGPSGVRIDRVDDYWSPDQGAYASFEIRW